MAAVVKVAVLHESRTEKLVKETRGVCVCVVAFVDLPQFLKQTQLICHRFEFLYFSYQTTTDNQGKSVPP